MSLSMYAATVPPMRLMLKNLSVLMSKAQAHCEAKKIDPNAFLASRLYPDMLPFTKQIQIASDTAKGAGARLANVEIPKFDDDEATFADLQARIDKTVAFLDTLGAAQFEGADSRMITLQLRDRALEFKGADYLTTWATPNFFFHVTTAYALLRHGGVEIGKTDYLAGSSAIK
ncbi:MAG: DUF1993 domain-containing protein [Burkholderiaceae bacterium]